MKNFYVFFFLLITMACGGPSSNNTTKSTTGQGSISFASISSKSKITTNIRMKTTADITPEDTVTSGTVFNFGDLRSTQAFFFELINNGTAEVDNVVISTDNPSVAVCTPASIGILPINGTGNIIPLVEVQVLHGIGLNEYGTAATLPAGSFTFNLTASGTDTNGNTVSASCSIQLNVLVASFKLLDYDNNEVTFGQRSSTWLYGATLPDPANGWYELDTYALVGNNQRFYYIQNTGNVDLNINDLGSCDNTQTAINQTIIAPAEATTLITMQYTAGLDYFTYFKLDDPIIINSSNTVFNNSVPTDPDGNFYLFYQYYENQ